MTAPSNKDAWLLDHCSNVQSQCGEDGVLAKVLSLLPDRDRWCVEFGAWDGKHMSNTYHLIDKDDCSAVLIEGNPVKVKDLEKTFERNPKVHPKLRFVGWEGKDTLDNILAETPIPQNFDLLSIDIDGNDYHVWNALEKYRPKVVIIEFNPTIPTDLDYVQPKEFSLQIGCSPSALERLGRSKGYELVCVLPWNVVFVDARYYRAFNIQDNSVRNLRKDTSKITWMFTGYNGDIVLEGDKTMPWHGVPMVPAAFQQIPWPLRNYPDNMGKIRRNLLGLVRAWNRFRLR